MHDEELAPGRVRSLGPGHAQNAPRVAQIVVKAICLEFALDAVAGAAHAGAVGAPALDHEPVNAPVENEPVIKPLFYERDEVIHALRRHIGV